MHIALLVDILFHGNGNFLNNIMQDLKSFHTKEVLRFPSIKDGTVMLCKLAFRKILSLMVLTTFYLRLCKIRRGFLQEEY